MRTAILISEIFGPTIAGEGPVAGLPTVFVRTGGCDYHCGFSTGAALAANKPDGSFVCDTLHAVNPKHKDQWEEWSADDIWQRVLDISKGFPLLVTLSGGNPALQPLGGLLDLGHADDYTFALETQGTVAQPWFSQLDHLVLSPKPPSSGMPFNRTRLLNCIQTAGERPSIALKVVVFSEADFEFARFVSGLHPSLPFYLQAGTPQLDGGVFGDAVSNHRYLSAKIIEQTLKLLDWVKREHWYTARVSFQQHVILWGDKRGV